MFLCVSFSLQECNVKMLTNAILHKKKQPDGPKNGMMINKTVDLCDPFSKAFRIPLVAIQHIGLVPYFQYLWI